MAMVPREAGVLRNNRLGVLPLFVIDGEDGEDGEDNSSSWARSTSAAGEATISSPAESTSVTRARRSVRTAAAAAGEEEEEEGMAVAVVVGLLMVGGGVVVVLERRCEGEEGGGLAMRSGEEEKGRVSISFLSLVIRKLFPPFFFLQLLIGSG